MDKRCIKKGVKPDQAASTIPEALDFYLDYIPQYKIPEDDCADYAAMYAMATLTAEGRNYRCLRMEHSCSILNELHQRLLGVSTGTGALRAAEV